MNAARAVGLLAGYAADRLLGDPSRHHPVAWFGSVATGLERLTYRDERIRGVLHVASLVGAAGGIGVAARKASLGAAGELVVTGIATWVVVGGTSLTREAMAVGQFLVDDDLTGARARLTHLVGRDTTQLTEEQIARATIESVAENTSDAVVAPLAWGAVAGVPGLLAYRAANTLDAMVGHRTARYERFGWAAARLDDVLNLVPSRIAATWAALLSDRPHEALNTWRRDASGHPSPNAGPVEASFAGALDVRLGGINRYGDRVEDRTTLGDGRIPDRLDIPRATRLSDRVGVASALMAAAVAVSPSFLRRGRRPTRPRAQHR